MIHQIKNWVVFGLLIALLNSCIEKINGCTVPQATNYNPEANSDDGSCTFQGQYTIAQNYGGGIIFYIDSTGEHGLIAAPFDQASMVPWHNGADIITNATGISIGFGQSNTNLITAIYGSGPFGPYAANICDTLTLNGYNDWYLPSKEELLLMSIQRNLIGGFSSNNYWSSTEYSLGLAEYVFIPSGLGSATSKNNQFSLRAIRSF